MSFGPISLTLLVGRIEALPAPPMLTEALVSVEVTQTDFGPSGFQMTFFAGRGDGLSLDYTLLSLPLLLPFNRVVLVAMVSGLPQVIMDGLITNHQLVPGNGPGSAYLAVTGEDISVAMDLQERSLEHPAQSPEMAVALTLAEYLEYGVEPVIIPTPFTEIPLPIDRTPIQTGTDLWYLRNLAARYGYVFFVRAGPLPLTNIAYWGPPPRFGVPQPALTVNMGVASNVDQLQFSYDALAPTLVMSETQGLELGETLPIDTFLSTRLPPFAALPAIAVNLPYVRTVRVANDGLDEIESLARAQAITDRSVDEVVQASGELSVARYGSLLQARDVVGVRGAGTAYDGQYYVQQVTHQLSRQDYRQSFRLTREGWGTTVPVVVP